MALTLLWANAFVHLDEISATFGLEGIERAVVGACYAPLLLWGPLLAAVTVSYARRTRRLARPATAGTHPAERSALRREVRSSGHGPGSRGRVSVPSPLGPARW